MMDANSLPYYPRFIFNCNDGRCLTTGDLEIFKHIKEKGSDYDISRFVPGQRINISWTNNGEKEVQSYEVKKIEIHQLKHDLDEPTYGTNMNDCTGLAGREKKWMMEIYVFLDAVK
jgi:hypothetical protein